MEDFDYTLELLKKCNAAFPVRRSAKETGKALKQFSKLLEEQRPDPNKPKPHTCTYCRYHHIEEWYDQEWGMYWSRVSWCDLDKSSIEENLKPKNMCYLKECPYFTEGVGKRDKL